MRVKQVLALSLAILVNATVVQRSVCIAGALGSISEPPTPSLKTSTEDEPYSLAAVWSIDGQWEDVDRCAESGALYGMRRASWDKETKRWTAEVCRIDWASGIDRTISIGGDKRPPKWLKVVRVGDNGKVAFVTGLLWHDRVSVYESGGSLWWKRDFRGVSRIKIADLDNNGADEIFIGTMDGLYVTHPDGSLLWHALAKRHARDMALLPNHSDAAATLVVQVSSSVLAFIDKDGRIVRETRPKLEYSGLETRVVTGRPSEVIAVSLPTLEKINADGYVSLRIVDEDPRVQKGNVSSIAVSPDGRWIAIIVKDGLLLVYDTITGKRVASTVTKSSNYPEIVWVVRGTAREHRVVVASYSGLHAFELRSKDVIEEPATSPTTQP